jgi:hypothetical protein
MLREIILTAYNFLRAVAYATKQIYLQWRYERAINKLMRTHEKQRHAIGKALLPALREFDEAIKDEIEKGA